MTNPTYALSRNALDLLAERLDSSETPDDFFAEADIIITDSANLLEMPFSILPEEDLTYGQEAANARIVYNAIGALDRANAADGRLWTYLALATFREYMEVRWPLTRVKNWKSRAQTRWLMSRASRQLLARQSAEEVRDEPTSIP